MLLDTFTPTVWEICVLVCWTLFWYILCSRLESKFYFEIFCISVHALNFILKMFQIEIETLFWNVSDWNRSLFWNVLCFRLKSKRTTAVGCWERPPPKTRTLRGWRRKRRWRGSRTRWNTRRRRRRISRRGGFLSNWDFFFQNDMHFCWNKMKQGCIWYATRCKMQKRIKKVSFKHFMSFYRTVNFVFLSK